MTRRADVRETVELALATFIDAFNQLDRARMDACFIDDPPVFLPWGGHRLVGFWDDRFDDWRAESNGPPYLDIQPKDLSIQHFGDAAVATFHLEHDSDTLARRTIVLCRTPAGWKIAHLHASTYPREGLG